MNTLSIGKWTAEEMNFLFAILTQVRDEDIKKIQSLMIYVSTLNSTLKNLNGGIIQ